MVEEPTELSYKEEKRVIKGRQVEFLTETMRRGTEPGGRP